MKKTIIAVLACAAALCLAAPAMAEEAPKKNTYTTADGILSIDLPNENWTKLEDPSKWVALSDGSNIITIEHYSNGEDLPGITVADSHYVNTLTAAFTTQNEVFIATGYVIDPAVMNSINESMLSIKVLKYDTKVAVTKEAARDEYTIVPRDMTMYVKVSDSLSVRNGYSVDATLIGSLANGTAVHVTGAVQKNGTDTGWMQIAFNNGSGFVAGNYLTSTAPAAAGNTSSGTSSNNSGSQTIPSNTSSQTETYLVYSQGSGRPVNLTGKDGVFYDGEGNVYYAIGGGNFSDNNGGYYSTTVPASAPDTNVLGLISDGSGRPVTIMENSDGSYTDEEGNAYYEQGDGSYADDYGATYQVSGTN